MTDRHDRIQYTTFKGRKYKLDIDHRMIWVTIPKSQRTPYPTERELDWLGATAFAVRKQIAKETTA